MILNVFVEGEPPPEENLPAGSKVPGYFIGEFSATAVTDTSVTLKPTSRLDAIDKKVMRSGNATWALYETDPVDGHRFFTTDPSQEADLTREADKRRSSGRLPMRC